jgi:hypothetical protein
MQQTWGNEECIQHFGRETPMERHFGTPTCRREDNIETDLLRRCGLGSRVSGHVQNTDLCKHGDESMTSKLHSLHLRFLVFQLESKISMHFLFHAEKERNFLFPFCIEYWIMVPTQIHLNPVMSPAHNYLYKINIYCQQSTTSALWGARAVHYLTNNDLSINVLKWHAYFIIPRHHKIQILPLAT